MNVSATEDFESGASGWTSSGIGNTWAAATDEVHTGTTSWHADEPGEVTDQYLDSPFFTIPSEDSPTVRFWNYQEIEDNGGTACWDGAVIEISTDGTNWTRLESEILVIPYTGLVDDGFDNPIGGSNAQRDVFDILR